MSPLQKLIALEKEVHAFGFTWPDINMIIEQAVSECAEIKQVIEQGEGTQRLQEEIGDLLHTAISLCVFANFNVGQTLEQVIQKFGARFKAVQMLTRKRGFASLHGQPIDLQLELWREAKLLDYSSTKASPFQSHFLEQKHIPLIVEAFAKVHWPKTSSLFEGYMAEQEQSERLVWVVFFGEQPAGYGTLKWVSSYDSFQKQNIPEINDLNVLPSFRKRGVGSYLLHKAEEVAVHKGRTHIGLGVGLGSEYGNAQKLYIKKGYIPNGYGITSHGHPVKYGDSACLDDDLILWLTKDLRGKEE